MKRYLLAAMAALLSVNCAHSRPNYVTTIYPFYEIVRNIVGDRGTVYTLLPPGASPHTYQLKASDMRRVETSLALILGGPGLDDWALRLPTARQIQLLDLVPDTLLLKLADHSEPGRSGVSHDEGKARERHNEVVSNGAGKAQEHRDEVMSLNEGQVQEHHHAEGIDPHFWTDPLLVEALLPALTDVLCEVDPDGAEIYRENTRRFAVKLHALYLELKTILSPVQGKAVMLSHPFYQYFFNRFGLRLVGITEFSPGKEPTPREIKGFIDLVKKEKVQAIFVHPQLPDRPARVVAEASGCQVYELDPLGGIPGRETYEELLRYNAQVLIEALR